jgi:hypothetical protein
MHLFLATVEREVLNF